MTFFSEMSPQIHWTFKLNRLFLTLLLAFASNIGAQQHDISSASDVADDAVVIVKSQQSGSFFSDKDSMVTTTMAVSDISSDSLTIDKQKVKKQYNSAIGKTMRVIDSPETTISVVMVAAPPGHEQRMELLRDAYTSSGLSSQIVTHLLQLDARMLISRDNGNMQELSALRDERESLLSLQNRQNIRKVMLDSILQHKKQEK